MSANGSKRATRKVDRKRLIVIDYWRRVLRNEPDPYGGVVKKFKLGMKAQVAFFEKLEIYEMSDTKH